MARPKKTALSPHVGTVTAGRKSGNPEFTSSSFYAPKAVNNRFNRAILLLKDAGYDLDRSDILAVLMDRFSAAVEHAAAQPAGEGTGSSGLDAILAAAGDQTLGDAAQVSGLVGMLRELNAEMKQAVDVQVAKSHQLLEEVQAMRSVLRAERDEVQAEWERLRALGVDTSPPSYPSLLGTGRASPPAPGSASAAPQD
jgi:hypothetical protein